MQWEIGIDKGRFEEIGPGEGSRPDAPLLQVTLVPTHRSPSRLNLYEKRGESDVEAPQFLILHALSQAALPVNCRCAGVWSLLQAMSRPVIEMSEDPHSYRVAWAAV